MLKVTDIDDALRALEFQFQRDQDDRKQQYLADRQALEQAREIAGRLGSRNGTNGNDPGASRSPSHSRGAQPAAANGTAQSRKARDLVREVVLEMPGQFRMRDVIDAAKRHSDPQIRALDEGTFHATMHWFKKHRLIDVVRERQSKTDGAIYRIASRDLRRPPMVSKRNLEFPLMDMVLETINASTSTFGRVAIFEKLRANYPEFADRIKIDSVGATLAKLASPELNKIRCVERNQQGNTYERI